VRGRHGVEGTGQDPDRAPLPREVAQDLEAGLAPGTDAMEGIADGPVVEPRHPYTMPGVGGQRDAGWTGVRDAAADRRSGAWGVALQAAEALAALPRSDLDEAVRALVEGHPSMAPMWRLGSAVLGAPDHREAAAGFARRVLAERDGVAATAASLLRFPALVVHSYSSTVIAAVARTRARALCARSEPGGEGAATAARLHQAGLNAEVLEDHEAVAAASAGTPVVVGADAVGPGGVVNKIRTGVLAGAARSGRGGCYVLAGSSKLVSVDLPAPEPFERVPLSGFIAILTEDAALDPAEAAEAATRRPLHRDLTALLPPS
jgi:translation initiation factor 2B subunit (eIF-2B alpha/beta/delta family)